VRRGSRARLALALTVVAACKPSAVEAASPGEPTVGAATAGDPELAEVARRIDPGPQPPLAEHFPTWLKDQLDRRPLDPKTAESVAVATEGIEQWDSIDPARDDPQAVFVGVMKLGAGLLLVERAVAAGDADPALLATLSLAYRGIYRLGWSHGSTVVQLARALGPDGGQPSSEQLGAELAAGRTLAERAAALQLHVTARVLREHPKHPAVSEVLHDASQVKLAAGLYPEAVALRQLAIARKGDRATGTDFAALALLCYRALDLPCADLARKTAEERGPGVADAATFKQRLAELDELAATAREAMAPAQSFEQEVERGHLSLRLGRLNEAEATFAALRASHPNDARPLTGLAVLAIHRGLDISMVLPQIRAARGLAGRDRRYHELALGTVPALLIVEFTSRLAAGPSAELDALFEEVLELTRGYREFDRARAAVLELLVKAARGAFPSLVTGKRDAALALLRKLPDQALALTKQFPESGDTWRLLFFMTRVAAGQGRARTLVTTPVPPALLQRDPDLRLQRARALVDLALAWEDRTLLAAAVQAASELPASGDSPDAAIVRATLDAVSARAGDLAAAQRAIAVFVALATSSTGREQALALNNAAVLLAQVGDAKGPATLLAHAQEAAPQEAPPKYNASALAFGHGAREGLPQQFTASVEASAIAALRLHARAWLVALADAGHGDGAALRREFAAALADEKAGEVFGNLWPGRWGVVEQNAQNVSVGYSTKEGLLLIDEVVPRWWLIVPAPTFDALVARKRTTRP
jgi:tetratricopeptide (TPR) repeat protein